MCLAIPGKLLEIHGEDPLERTGRVSFGGAVRRVNLAYVPEAEVGDYVNVHVGFALSVVDEVEARRVFDYLDQLGDALRDLDPPAEAGAASELAPGQLSDLQSPGGATRDTDPPAEPGRAGTPTPGPGSTGRQPNTGAGRSRAATQHRGGAGRGGTGQPDTWSGSGGEPGP